MKTLSKAKTRVFESAKRLAKSKLLSSAQELCIKQKEVDKGSYLPLRIRRLKNGILPLSTLIKKYGSNISIKEGDDNFESQYLVRTKDNIVLGYGEVLKYSKDHSMMIPRMIDINKMSLRVLPMFSGITRMLDCIAQIDEYETFNYVDNPDYNEFEYQDGVSIREILVIYTYKAKFGSREIVYKTVGRHGNPFDFRLLKVHVAEVKARNKIISEYNSLKNRLERYEDTLNRQSDEDIGIGDGSYEPLRVVLR